ncbi:MAG: hypothetical protein H0X38_05100 [Planctomycetes bacterium]|nr:hypothetical protein [Planctomycetota bacterium]
MTTASENLRFICNSCGFRARIPVAYKGKVILCPGCQAMKIVAADGSDPTGSTVAVRRVETATTPVGTYSTPDATGKIRFTCSACGYLAKLGIHYAGKAIACPSCESPQLIPPLAPTAVAAPKAEIELALDLSAPSAPEAAPAPAARSAPAAPTAPVAPAPVEEADFSLDEPETKAKPELSAKPALRTPAALPRNRADEPAAVTGPGLEELMEATPPPAPPKPAAKPIPRGKPAASVAPAAAAPAEQPTPRPKIGGVVRRGNKPVDADEEDVADEDADGTDTPPAKPKVSLNPAGGNGSLVEQLKQPPALYVTILAAVTTVLTIAFLILWRLSAGAATTEHERAESYTGKFETESKAHRDAVLERDGQASELQKANAKLEAALAAGRKTTAALATAESENQAAKADADGERTQRKAAEGKLDAALAKAAKAEVDRDETLRQLLEKIKALKEETAMRKQFQDRVKELDAKTK